jgi:hypothetical protein
MALAAMSVVFSGFARQFYLRPVDLPPMPLRVVAHASLFSAWVLLFVAQTTLVASEQVAIHRRLGIVAAAVAATMVVTSPALAIGLARRGGPSGSDPLVFMLVIVTDVVLFGAFVGAGIYRRRDRDAHKRLMLLAMIVLLPASISRWPIAGKNPATFIIGVFLAFVLAMLSNDLVVRRRPHPVTVWGGIAMLASLPLRFTVAQTDAWHRFASWLIQ